MARFLLKLRAAGIARMNMTNKGRMVFRRECELTGTKSAFCPPRHGKAVFRTSAVSLAYITRAGGGVGRSQEYTAK